MKNYLDLCEHILLNGGKRQDRTGTGTIGIFGAQMRFDLAEGFPLMTTKDMAGSRLDAIIYELLWFLNGDTNVGSLIDNDVNIWNPDAYRYYLERTTEEKPLTYKEFVEEMKTNSLFRSYWGHLGRIYGAQWRSWNTTDRVYHGDEDYPRRKTIDQIANVIESIKKDPFGRRHLVTAWNPAELDQMALPPCHVMFQFYVSNDYKLSCQLYQRSGDVFLGVPFNIASYALLTMMVADQCNLGYGEFVHTLGDTHIYTNHIDQVMTQIKREPLPLPKMLINNEAKDIFSYKRSDFLLTDYKRHSALKGNVSVGL